MKNLIDEIIDIIKEEYKFILLLIILGIIALFPVNYYITVGGGIKDIGDRVEVENSYKEKGSFNITYVSQINSTVSTYLLSYIIPSWERSKVSDYAYNDEEEIKDIEYREKIELKASSANAIYNAYKEANKKIEETSHKYLVIANTKEYKNNFEIGDEIVSVNNQSFYDLKEYRKLIDNYKDDTIKVKVKRKDKITEINAKLYKEKETNRRVLGIYLSDVHTYKTDPKVKIKFKKNESGPSGGLLTALSIYNKLTKEDITKGYTIVATGTMEPDGTVGPIGGIKYKLLGANKKADYFLVPDGDNYKEALKIKKEKHLKIKLIKVKTFKDAVIKLENIK